MVRVVCIFAQVILGTVYEVVTPNAIIRQKSREHATSAVAWISPRFPGGWVFARKRSWWKGAEWIAGNTASYELSVEELNTTDRPSVGRRSRYWERSHNG